MTTLQHVELGVLGPLQVRQYGLPVAIPGAKPRAILTMLGLHGGSVVSADMLVELLWGDDPPRTAAKALQTHISALRRTLGDGFVLTEGTGWTVRSTEIDATRYKVAVRLGRDAVAAGDVGQAVVRFDEALSLWRGTPELPDTARGTSEKTRWIEGYNALVEDRADALLATGRAAEVIGELEAAVADAPLRERRWGQLMLALYRAGRQGEALGAYQRARSLLAEELGVDPGPDLRRLEAAIVAQDDTLELPVAQQLSVVTRAVTFLLTDIEGSTAAWEADADAMAAALARHDEMVEQVVTSRGGRLIKTRGEGDATFSVFDRPSAAAAAAIELQEAIRHEPWVLAEPMRIRVALHTGEVELRGGDYFGRAVNRAARLRSLAAGGQILCSGATAELVIDTLSDDVLLVDLGSRQLKNLARPEHVFELRLETAEEADDQTAEAPPMPRPVLPTVLAGPGPFVGRGQELAGLLTAWQSTLTVGTRAVLVAGEPGVGKTRLAGEWSRQVYEDGAVVLYGRCDEDLGAAYQPFAEALRSLVPCLGADRVRGLRGVEALLPLVPGLTDAVPDLPTPSRSDPDTERYALFDAVVALLGAVSASAPVVLILDDLHWAAKPTLLLLRHLLRFGEHARVQIVGTYRSTDLDRSHPLAAMLIDLHRDGSAVRLALTGLDEKDVSAYVSEAGYNDEELARALASVTGGNPFFLIEALRHVEESGGRWDPNTLPQGVREAVSRRLSRLSTDTNKALAAAAVVGSRFAVELVERVVDGDLVDAFDEACKAGIVIEEPGGRYRFNHALVRQSLLAELPSVRRMRLHQRIAVTLEAEPGAEDELLAELAYHYFECAWAGNAAKAVEYCQRAADQAMARLAYEGAADLYDRALHALEELDDELPDRDALQAELLVARCEALLAAGDVASAAGAVSQLQQAAGDSVRLAAWGTCFDGQLSMLTDPERLDEIEAAVAAAAEKLAELEDAAGEAMAHTVRAACLARLGRIGDAETALDQALTAARRANDHRRVNAVLAGAPLAALWGPNPVPRAGGRCLDVVRLLRITTGSPVVEATSTRCQGVLDALRGRAAAGRALIDSARRSLTELGMRHALLELEQFAGIVELIADEPAAAEPLLRRACDGFRRMGLDADTAETAAFLARACLALDRDAEADELCIESERLAGHALKPSITWRTVRAQLLARSGAHDEARRVAEEAVRIAERTDALVDHGDACLTLALVLQSAGDVAGARIEAEQAIVLFERKGAAALAELARSMLGSETSAARTVPETPVVEPENQCSRTLRRVEDAVNREAWSEVEQAHAQIGSIESRRKIVGFERIELPSSKMTSGAESFIRDMRIGRSRRPILAVRGERLALTRTEVGVADDTPGAPMDEMLQLVGLDEDGRIAVQIWFDVEDIDAAMVELDAQQAGSELDTACVRLIRQIDAAYDRDAWEEVGQYIAAVVSVESRRKIVGVGPLDNSQSEWLDAARHYRQTLAQVRYRHTAVAARGERLALTSLEVGLDDQSPGAPRDALLQLYGLDEAGRLALHIHFDIDDLDAAMAELDAQHARFEEEHRALLENAASHTDHRFNAIFAERRWDEIASLMADEINVEDRRRGLRRQGNDRATELAEVRAVAEVGVKTMTSEVVATRGDRLTLVRTLYSGRDTRPDAFHTELLRIAEVDDNARIVAYIVFDREDLDAAFEELDARYLAGEAAPHAHAWSMIAKTYAAFNRNDPPNVVNFDHRRAIQYAAGQLTAAMYKDVAPNLRAYIEVVHRLDNFGAVVTVMSYGTSHEGFDAERRQVQLLTVDGDVMNRKELFDEADVDTALARFDELSRPAPPLDNAASRILEGYLSCFPTRDWDVMAQSLADSFEGEDRRRIVTRSPRRDRVEEIANLQVIAELGCSNITSTPIANRGERLVLAHHLLSAPGELFEFELIDVVEVDGDNQIVNAVSYDPNQFDAAIAELDSRYVAGETAQQAHTWSVVAGVFAALNRHEMPAATPNCVNIDHRRGTPLAHSDLEAIVKSLNDLTPDLSNHVETVHLLRDNGALFTQVSRGTSPEGFDAEWRIVNLLMVEGDLVSRCELFDESDLDAAVARFDELGTQATRLENTASLVNERLNAAFTARDWTAMADILADNSFGEDRRRVVNVDLRGRHALIDSFRSAADLGGVPHATVEAVATRGERLVLSRTGYSLGDDEGRLVEIELLQVVEIDADDRVERTVTFDVDDFDAAMAEFDARFAAGEAAQHAQAWSAIAAANDALNRHEIPPTAVNMINIDHRRIVAIGEAGAALSVEGIWAVAAQFDIHIEAVHRLSDHGAVVTHAAYGTSPQGFNAEWRGVNVLTVEGDLINRCELFDEADLDAALARFDELSTPPTRLENTASRVYDRVQECNAVCDWDALADLMTEDLYVNDRRPVVGVGIRRGRDAAISDMRATAELGLNNVTSAILAIRGDRLALVRSHYSRSDHGSDAFLNEVICLYEINVDDQIAVGIVFNPDEIDTAIAELESRYLAGEAADYARTWAAITRNVAAYNKGEWSTTTPNWITEDHRRVARFTPEELSAAVRDSAVPTPEFRTRNTAVHRLNDSGAVVTTVSHGISPQGFEAEWKVIQILTVEGDLINRCELFDETDLDAALAKFDELSGSTLRLENAASRVVERFNAHFAARDWVAVAELLADDVCDDDRRRVVNSAKQIGRSARIANLRAVVDLGMGRFEPVVIATRGERLALTRPQVTGGGHQSDTYGLEPLSIAEINTHGQIAATVHFDVDDVDSAFAELDARYLAGEAAANAHTWSVIVGNIVAFNNHELPAWTPDLVSIDYRTITAFEPGDHVAYIRATWDQMQDVRIYIETVHRLSDRGAVITYLTAGTAQQDFEAEWRGITVLTIDGDRINRSEQFDDADLGAALARFDELSRPASLVENSATRTYQRFIAHYVARDWTAMADMIAADTCHDDRRRVVNGGIMRGRDAVITSMRVVADVGVTVIDASFIATRGDRLALARQRVSGGKGPDSFGIDVLVIADVDADNQLGGGVAFDPDDLEAAIAELDARYANGEAAAHARTWSTIAECCVALSRRQLPATAPDFVAVDRRRLANIGKGDMTAFFQAAWELTPNMVTFVEAVDRLSDLGAVVTQLAQGTSDDGFYAEWRVIVVYAVKGDLLSRCEVFDEADLDLALARFDELSRPAPQLQNAASQMITRFQQVFGARDWEGMAEFFADDICLDDRRPVVGAEFVGRDATIANMRASADTGVKNVTSTILAIRGDRLSLQRVLIGGRDNRPEAFRTEALLIAAVDDQDRATAFVMFDLDDVDAAFENLDGRYLAGEAAGRSDTWSAIAEGYAAFNRREMPKTTPDWVNIDHRRGGSAFAPGDQTSYIHATWEVAPQVKSRATAVHRLSDLGAVVTQVTSGTSHQGFDVEWHDVILFIVDGELLDRCEVFDEDDLDAALAKFNELTRQALRPLTLWSQVAERFRSAFAARDWDAMAEMVTEDLRNEDRRSVVNAGIRYGQDPILADMRSAADLGIPEFRTIEIATRGERLGLVRAESHYGVQAGTFYVENLAISEIDADQRISAQILFDIDDIEAAFDELDTRYLAGEASAHAHAWSVIAGAYRAYNRREDLPTTPNWVNIDRRRLAAVPSGEMAVNVRGSWEMTPNLTAHIETVHRLSDVGVVVTDVAHGTSPEGFEAEWREINLLTIDGDRISRCEIFDEDDLDVAIARFDELSHQRPDPENMASRLHARLNAAFAARDWNALGELVTDDTSTAIATRGEHLALSRYGFAGHDIRPESYRTEVLGLVEIDSDQRMTACVMLDLGEMDAAFAELEALYLAGEAAPHAQTWDLVADAFAAMNRREIPATTPGWATVDHRRLSMIDDTNRDEYLAAAIDVTQFSVYIESAHRLSDAGAVIAWQGNWTTPEGFDAEWRGISVLTFADDLVDRCELFDENDLAAAIARFDELNTSATHLENSASRAYKRFNACFVARDWDAMAEVVADAVCTDDRRHVINGGIQRGRAAHAANMRAAAGVWVKHVDSFVIAIRGDRLALISSRVSGDQHPDAFNIEMLMLVETGEDGRVVTSVLFDLDDIDAAFAELDGRYIAREAVTHAAAWSVVADGYAALNRQELPSTSNWVVIDHRVRETFEGGDLTAYIRSGWDVIPGVKNYIQEVHRLSNFKALVTHAAYGTSPEGFDAEWRMIALLTFAEDSTNRAELFDEADLDAAVAKFDELTAPAPRLENAATRIWARLAYAFNSRSVDTFVDLTASDGHFIDRRKGLRDSHEGPMRRRVVETLSEYPQSWRLGVEHIAVRGSRLCLSRQTFRDFDDAVRPITEELLTLTECAGDNLVRDFVLFDPDDIDAAIEELDAQFLAGSGAACSHIWNLVNQTYARFNRHELSPTTPDWVNLDHRRGIAPAAGEMHKFVSAMWAVAPDVRTCIESVHRLTSLGAVFTHAEVGTSREGFDAEWREVTLLTFDGDLINRCELFDEDDLDAALARFDELALVPSRLDNLATRPNTSLTTAFNCRSPNAYGAALDANARYEDRRRGLRSEGPLDLDFARGMIFAASASWQLEIEAVAIRGHRLALSRYTFRDNDEAGQPVVFEALVVTEGNDDALVTYALILDPDDIDSAFEELESRYLAGEAVAHAQTWSVIANTYAALNRYEIYPTTTDLVSIDHRPGVPFAPGDLIAYVRAAWVQMPDLTFRIDAVHRLSDVGAVFTEVLKGTTQEGFVAEWRLAEIMTVEGDRINRAEIFDEAQLDDAIARFDELTAAEPLLKNALARVLARVVDAFDRRDPNRYLALFAEDCIYEDRRKGLRDAGSIRPDYAQTVTFGAAAGWQAEFETIAVRGHHLMLGRATFRDQSEAGSPIAVEALNVGRVTNDELISWFVVFDPDDIDAAFGELTAQWIASGEVAHPAVIEVAQELFEVTNRHDWDGLAARESGATFVNHRQLGIGEQIVDHWSSIRTMASLIPDMRVDVIEIPRYSANGLVTNLVVGGTTLEGTAIELPAVIILLFDKMRVTRMEAFDLNQRELALARFDELNARG